MDLKQEWSPMLGIYEPQLLVYISKYIETLIRWQMLWLKKKRKETKKSSYNYVAIGCYYNLYEYFGRTNYHWGGVENRNHIKQDDLLLVSPS